MLRGGFFSPLPALRVVTGLGKPLPAAGELLAAAKDEAGAFSSAVMNFSC